MEGQWGRWRLAAAAAASSSGDQIAAVWAVVRARAVAPVLQFAVWACMAMSVMLVLEVAYMSLVSLVAVKLLRRVPERRYKWEPITTGSGGVGGGDGEDEEAATGGREAAAFPMVLVQIPMYNEKEVRRWNSPFSPLPLLNFVIDQCTIRFGIGSVHPNLPAMVGQACLML